MLIFHALIISFSNALPLKKNLFNITIYSSFMSSDCFVLIHDTVLYFFSWSQLMTLSSVTSSAIYISLISIVPSGISHQKMAQRVCKRKKYQASEPKIAARHLISFSQTPQMLLCIITARLTSFWSLRYKEVVFNNYTGFIGKLTK